MFQEVGLSEVAAGLMLLILKERAFYLQHDVHHTVQPGTFVSNANQIYIIFCALLW
jgi:hypothetical protein